MSPSNPDDPAIYGPVNGQFVTLSEFQAWQQATFAANQAAASQQFQQAEQDTGITAPNPYVPVATSTPVVLPTSSATPPAVNAHDLAFTGDLGNYCDLFPDDPLCELWGGGGIGIAPSGGGTTIEQPVIIEQGISGVDVNAAIDAGLGSVWAAVVGSVDALTAAVIAALQSAVTGIGNALKAAYAVLSRLAGFILQALQSILRGVVAGILGALNDIREILSDLYKNVLLPIAAALSDLRARLVNLYQQFIRPLLIWIQSLRQLLAILSIFHVNFAIKLDQKLAQLEARIAQPLLFLLSYTNGIANWVNLISTVNYLIQKPIWLASLHAYAGSTTNALINAINPPPDPVAAAALQATNNGPTAAQSYVGLDQWIQTGTGPTGTEVQTYSSYFDQVMQQGF